MQGPTDLLRLLHYGDLWDVGLGCKDCILTYGMSTTNVLGPNALVLAFIHAKRR